MEANKSPKADLENKKFFFKEIGLIVSLVIVFFAFNIKTHDKQPTEIEITYRSDIAEELIPVTVHESKPLPPPPPRQTIKINIVENDINVEDELIVDAEANQETVIEEYIPYVIVEEEEEEIIEEPVFVVVESMPSFPGGMGELMKYLQKNIKFPNLAKEAGIQGRVFVSFVIEKDGSVTDVTILRGIGGGCDEEAIRVVEKMPNWIPGQQRNVPVRVSFNLPIKFTLQ